MVKVDEDQELVLFADRPEWSDVTPIPQHDEGANPIAPIYYTAEYKDATDYFRGVVKKGEMSERVLELTEVVIRLNSAHYSAWQYRYRTLLAINAPIDVELKLMDELAITHLKSYQVWHHRRLLLSLLRDRTLDAPEESSDASEFIKTYPAAELLFIARGLSEDAKNYHTWAYRQWILAHFNSDDLWADELQFVEDKLDDDVRNNSAWHHRFFVVFASGVRKGEENRDEVLRREVLFTKTRISHAPNNASAWNYLRGILDHTQTPYNTQLEFAIPYSLHRSQLGSDVDEPLDLDNPRPSNSAELPCAAALEFVADVHEAENNVEKAVELWKSLASEHDPIRKRYWEYRIQEATK